MSRTERSFTKTNIFLTIFLAIIVISTILSALYPDFGNYFSIGNWFNQDALNEIPFGIALTFVMMAAFFGALIPVPVPYAIPVTLFSAAWYLEFGLISWPFIILTVACATAANTTGDLIDYLIGRGTERVLSKDDPELQDRWSQIILKKPKVIPGVVVAFGVTPLPDSLLMVPLGIVEYDCLLVGSLCFLFLPSPACLL